MLNSAISCDISLGQHEINYYVLIFRFFVTNAILDTKESYRVIKPGLLLYPRGSRANTVR